MKTVKTATDVVKAIQSKLKGLPRIGIIPSPLNPDKWTYLICILGMAPRDVVRIDDPENRYGDFALDTAYVQEFISDTINLFDGQRNLNSDNENLVESYSMGLDVLHAVMDGISAHGVISLGRKADNIDDDVIVGRANWVSTSRSDSDDDGTELRPSNQYLH